MEAAAEDLVVVHVSPHSDDEAVGCPATIRALTDVGWPVTNLLTSLGAPAEQSRRRAEAQAAADTAGLRLVVMENTAGLALGEYEITVAAAIIDEVGARTAIVISPSPHDNHPRHEAAARAASTAVRALKTRATWWMYGVWGALPLPTLAYNFDAAELARAEELLDCYPGEIGRNDYRVLVHGRASANRILGVEQIFGFGRPQTLNAPYVELFTEVLTAGTTWEAGTARILDPAAPRGSSSGRDVTAWVEQPSPRQLVGWTSQ